MPIAVTQRIRNDLTRRPEFPKDLRYTGASALRNKPAARPTGSPGGPSTYAPDPQRSILGEFTRRLRKYLLVFSKNRLGGLSEFAGKAAQENWIRNGNGNG